MAERYPDQPGPGSTPSTNSPSTKDTAQEQAGQVRDEAAQAGQHVTEVAKQEAHNVGAEAGHQARDLWHQARSDLTDHAGQQQQRAAGTLHQLADDLGTMADASSEQGIAADLVRQVSGRTHDAAGWLDRDPASLLEEVKSFARRKPGTFLALAAGIGFVAARMGRGIRDDAHQDSGSAGTGGTTTTGTRDDLPARTAPVGAPTAGIPGDAQRGPEGLEHATSGGYSAYGSGSGTAVPPEETGSVSSELPNDPTAWTGDATGGAGERGRQGGAG